jgi:ABC-type dipeptide/oligopeptide/nickel transport system permease subunit
MSTATVPATAAVLPGPFHNLRQFAVRLGRVRQASFGGALVCLVVLAALLAPWIVSFDPIATNLYHALKAPSWTHLMGTDELGRDIFSRVLYGARTSLVVGVLSVAISLVVGLTAGLISGYYRGWIDNVLMRIMDALLAFPVLLLALAIAAVLGASSRNVIIAIGIVFVPYFARLVRGQVLYLRELDYVMACRISGGSDLRIIWRHILPNALSPVIVQASLSISFAMIVEASLSFLGLGVQPPAPSWGSMLKAGYPYMASAPWLAIWPGVILAITVLGFNLLGDGIRDALDPRLRRLAE